MKLKWLHKKISNIYSIAPMILLILFASYKSTPSTSIAGDYTPQDVFTSIFFSRGDLASQLPVLQHFNIRKFTSDEKVINRVTSEQDKIYAHVKSLHPEYLNALKAAVGSGDRLRIANVIKEGARYINEAHSSIFPDDNSEVRESLAKDFAKHIDLKNATPEQLRQAINDYASGIGESPEMGIVVQWPLVLIYIIVIMVTVPLLADGKPTEASLATEMIIDALAKSSGN